MAPSLGFEIPILGLFAGLVVLAIGLFLSGLNVVTVAGVLLGFAGIVGLLLAVLATSEPSSDSPEETHH